MAKNMTPAAKTDAKNRRAERRAKVVELAAQGMTVRQIARQVGAGVATVHRDLEAVRRQWMEHATELLDAHVGRQLVELDVLERAAWTDLQTADDVEVRVKVGGLLLRILERRARLLGLDAPTRVALPAVSDDDEPIVIDLAQLAG